jgi:pimeloyl-ACP methyl ester carboxylesterase
MSTGVDEVGDEATADDDVSPGDRIRLDFDLTGPGDATTVVLVHGSPDRSGTFRVLLDHLTDLRVVRYDRRGYGRSLEAGSPTSGGSDDAPTTTMLDHALDLIDVLERNEPPCVVVAHSFGSNPAMLAATLRPELFRSLGLWEPPTVWVDWWPQTTKDYDASVAATDDPEGTIEEIYRRFLGDRTWDALAPEVQARRRREGFAFKHDMGSLSSAPFAFSDVTVPALVGYGSETSDEHVEGAIWLARELPDGQVHAVDGVGHFANRTHPGDFATFVRAVIEREPVPDVSR